LAGDTYKFEEVSCSFGLSFLDRCAFYAKSYFEEHFVEPCAPPPQVLDYAPPFCDSCQSFKHDTNSCPYVIAMAFRLEHLEHEMNNYSESIENTTRAFMEQFLGLVRDCVESIMCISHETDLRVRLHARR